MASNSNASHSQIWDDSSLVNSWNDALEEYKKYHSIKARGENIEKVLKEVEKKDHQKSEDVHYQEDDADDHPAQDPRAKEKASEETADLDITSQEENVPVVEQRESSNRSPALPQPLIGQVHDEGLKNLLMSWYYAGYYTGLHEGKQAAQGDKAAKHEAKQALCRLWSEGVCIWQVSKTWDRLDSGAEETKRASRMRVCAPVSGQELHVV